MAASYRTDTLSLAAHRVRVRPAHLVISVDGERATSESHVHACIRVGDNDVVARGRYLDTWSRRDGE
jgi:hypothetical protein